MTKLTGEAIIVKCSPASSQSDASSADCLMDSTLQWWTSDRT